MADDNVKAKSTAPTGKRYGSVAEMMSGMGISEDVQQKVRDLARRTQFSQALATMRTAAGLTQQQMADHFGVTQGAISKWEMGPDDELTVNILYGYAKATKQRFVLSFGRPPNHVESVKMHAMEIKKHLEALAAMAKQDEELEPHIQRFFGEAFFNILAILAKVHEDLPSADEPDLQIQLISGEQGQPKRRGQSGIGCFRH